MSGSGNVAGRVVAALLVVALVGVAGWGSWQNRRDRADAAPAAGAPARTVASTSRDAAPTVVALPRGCWAQAGIATDPADGLAERIALRYCLDPLGESTMTLAHGESVRCRASVLPQPLGARVRLAMARVPDCAFGAPLPLFDALCDAPEGEQMACDIDWGGGLVESFRLRRS